LPDGGKGQATRQATYRPTRKSRQETKTGALGHSPDLPAWVSASHCFQSGTAFAVNVMMKF
jgi:hypothetical protein